MRRSQDTDHPPDAGQTNAPVWIELCAEMHVLEATATTQDGLDAAPYLTLARLELTIDRRHPLLDRDLRTAYVAAFDRASRSPLPLAERLRRLARNLHELEKSATGLVDVLAAGRAAGHVIDAVQIIRGNER